MSDLDQFPSPRLTRLGLLIAVPLVVVGAMKTVAWAASLKTWNSGDTLNASDLNANFSAMVDVTNDQTIAGTKTFSGNVSVNGTLAIGMHTFMQSPTNAGTCVRVDASTWDCMCPSGSKLVGGGAWGGISAGGKPQFVNESRALDSTLCTGGAAECYRFRCEDETFALRECGQFTFTCARLGS